MKTRPLNTTDINTLREINDRCHPHDAFPDFFEHCYSPSIVITDDNDHIIIACTVKCIAEAITITDNQFSSHVRITALLESLGHMILTCGRVHHDYLHIFVNHNDKTHIKAIKKVGFKSLDSDPFFLEV